MSTTRMTGRAYPPRLVASRLLALTAASWFHPSPVPGARGSSMATPRHAARIPGVGGRDAVPAPDDVVLTDLMRYGL